MLSKKVSQRFFVICLIVLVAVSFSNQTISQQLSDQPLFSMAQAKGRISQTAWQKIPTTVRPLIDASKEYLEMTSSIMEVIRIETDEPEIGLLVKSKGAREELISIGATVGSHVGDIFTVHIPINRLSDLAAMENVVSIEPSMKVYPSLDASIVENNANLVHQGDYSTTPPTYSGHTGKDVLVVAIDTGIDWAHGDFVNDSDGTSRILYIWDQTLTFQTGESYPPGFFYGVEYTQTDINDEIDGSPAGYVRTEDSDGHGTHVMGIIAGDGSSTGGAISAYSLVGMAPQADIMFVKTDFYTSQIMDGIQYAMQRADEIGKPLVINLSLGSQYGAHDGTSLFDQGINNAINTGKVTIVVAAGNEGTDSSHGEYIHAEGTVTTGTTDTTTFTVPTYSTNSGGGNDLLVIDLWYQGGDSTEVQVITPNGYTWYANTGSDRNSTFFNSSDGAIYIDNASVGIDPNNGDRECYIQIWDYYSYRPPKTGTWIITVTGNTITESGHYDSWIYLSQVGNKRVYYTSTSGSNKETIGTPGTAEGAITVAAHSTKTFWTDYLGATQTVPGAVLGDLAYFSSVGPTRDDPGYILGRQKPDISASGFGVISARSTDAIGWSSSPYRNIDGVHLMMWGTSMSAPHIAGAVALMMQKDPTLSAQQVKTILTSSAHSDSYTGSVPNYLWGYGKLDIYNAMQQIEEPQQAVSLFPSNQIQDEIANETVSYSLNVKNLGLQSDSYDLTISANSWPASTWDASGMSPISNTGSVAAGSQIEIMIKVEIPAGTPGSTSDHAIIRATSASNSNVYDQASLITCTIAELPWMDNFTTEILDTVRWVVNVGPAEVNTDGNHEPSYSYSLNLDGNERGGDMVHSQSINLLGKENVMLRYYYERTGLGNSPEYGDDLWVDYYNSSGSWVNLRYYPGSGADMSYYMPENILLPADALHKRFKIRFHNVGTTGPNDDWFIDNVVLEQVFYPDISIAPDSLQVSLTFTDSTTQIMTIENKGEGDLNFSISTTHLYSQANKQNLSQFSNNEHGKGGFNIISVDDKGTNSKNALYISKDNNIQNAEYSETTSIREIPQPNPDNEVSFDEMEKINHYNSPENIIDISGSFSDDFEDGDYDGWITRTGTYSRSVTNQTAANGTVYSFTQTGGSNNHYDGVYYSFQSFQPYNIGFYIRSSNTSAADGYVVIGNNSTTVNGGIIFFYANAYGRFSVYPGDASFPYVADTWYHVEFKKINWNYKVYDYYVDGTLVAAGLPFRSTSTTYLSRIYLYNFNNSQAWWDEIHIGPKQEVNWLNPEPVLGTISAGGSQEIAVKINTMGLAFDSTYHAALVIESNDPDEPNKSIPVHLTVNAPINISGTVDSAGVALEGVVVQAWDNYPDGTIVVSDTSDAEGRFTSYVWNEGIYDLRAFASGFFPVIAENVQAPASGINLSLEALPSVTPTNEWIDFYGSNTTFWYAPVQIGDVVVAKDPDGVFCGVFEINKSGNYGLMSVYRDDVTTTNVDEGANPGEVISFEINRNKAITLGPDSPVWTSNGAILNVDLAVFPETEVEIPMVAGWNLLSWNIDTPNDSSSVLLKEIMAKVIVVLGYEGGGLTYDPSLPQFSTLLTMEHLHGYWIRLTDGDTLRLTGIPVDRATTPIFCEAGWNLVSYLPNKPDSIAHAFSTVMDNLIVAIGFYEGGLTYYPTLPQFSTLQVLAPTFGYWLKLTEEDTIIYPEPLPGATSEPIGPLALTDGMGLDRMTPGDIIPTTEWINIYGEGIKVDGELLSVATVVKAIDIEGRVCGRYVVKQPGKFGLMPIYRDDVTSEVDEGAMPGEEISIYFDDFELPTKINWTMMGDIIDLGKIIITSIGELSALPKEFALSQNYPNPFNPETVISYQLPKTAYTILKIYNTLGQEVKTLVNEQKESGYHKVVWDGKDNLGNQVTSGVYFYRIKADKFQHTIKMIFLY